MKALDDLRELAQDHNRLHSALGNGLAQSFYVIIPKGVLDYCIDEVERELEERYMLLPLDKDDVPICVGDKVVSEYGEETRVIAVSDREFVTISDQICLKSSKAFHHDSDVSCVLREFAIACEGNSREAVNRLISEYAERLQLKEE